MAHFTLNDTEIENLLSNIIQSGKANKIESWLQQIPDVRSYTSRQPNDPLNKNLAYKDYVITFYYTVDSQTASVQSAVIQLRRPSRFSGWLENRRIIKFLKTIIGSCYPGIFVGDSAIVQWNWKWGVEARLTYEPKSAGQNEHPIGPLNDFIIFQFDRDLRPHHLSRP